ncbi:DoxX family protein [Flagellimonas halotolerans]|uniref:DoxX family protein n=1 Tax=Flagellimonas halotolerans TaxID=3112164 RepID=A0ABU6IRE3_9FLAO|nr:MULTISPECIES: DoxX family protein [unclassified Allomuricauda]MEC3965840.1 DoxX family protein [Muricauda sp. SYSU M86414]MEC4265694.1 DoxX family protein [Muricauda sp. SYSU M84420]
MKNRIVFVLSLLLGLMFINAGLNKFFNYMPVPEDIPEKAMKMIMAMTEITWLMPLLAIVEIIGGVLFMIPRFRALGALAILPIMTGIISTSYHPWGRIAHFRGNGFHFSMGNV